MALPIPVWNQLNISWIIFFVVMGLINLYVAFNFPIGTWVSFKLFGATGLMLVFIVGQILMLNKYLKDDSNTSLVNAQDVDETGNILKKNEKE